MARRYGEMAPGVAERWLGEAVALRLPRDDLERVASLEIRWRLAGDKWRRTLG